MADETGRTSKARQCKRKISYSKTDELLDFILSENTDGNDLQNNSTHKKAANDDDKSESPNNKNSGSKKSRTRPKANVVIVRDPKAKKQKSDKSRKKETSVEIKEKPKKSKSRLKKAAFRSIAKRLRKVPINTVADFARQIINSELHVKEIENRRNIVQTLEETKEMENLVKNIYLKGIKFTEESLSTILKDRQAVYKIRFTFYVRDMLRDSASNPMKWFHSYKKIGKPTNDSRRHAVQSRLVN
eukprot:gene12449-13736_t